MKAARLALVPVMLIALAYVRCLDYPFVYDDISGIVNNPLINSADTIGRASHALLEPWRPLTHFSYAATHAMFGFNRRAFHSANVVIHVLNTLLIFGIGIRVAKRWMPEFNPTHFAFLAATVHAVHPLYTEAVTYISGRSSSLCALFYFGCLFLVMQGLESRDKVPQTVWFCGAAISGVLAWGAKEEAITLPIILAIFLMLSGYRKWAIGLIALPFIVLVTRWQAITLLYQTSAANKALVDIGLGTPIQSLPYALSEIKAAVFYYLSHFAIPLTQSIDPYFRTVQSIFEPGLLIAVAILGILFVIAVRFSTQQPALTFAIAALLVSPLLSYSIIPLPDIVAEHRVYIAGLGFDLLAAAILIRRPRIMFPAIAALALALTVSTIARNSIWASDVTLWRQAEKNSRNQVRPHLNLGVALQAAGQPDAALKEYWHAVSMGLDLPLIYSNMGTIYLGQKRVNEAETMLKRAIERAPSMPQPYINLGSIAVYRKNADEALEYAAKAEAAGAESYWVHFIRAEALTMSGQPEAAQREYELAAKFIEGHNAPLRDEIQKRLSALRSRVSSAK